MVYHHAKVLDPKEATGFANSFCHNAGFDDLLWHLGLHRLLDRARSHQLRVLNHEFIGSKIVQGGKVEDGVSLRRTKQCRVLLSDQL